MPNPGALPSLSLSPPALDCATPNCTAAQAAAHGAAATPPPPNPIATPPAPSPLLLQPPSKRPREPLPPPPPLEPPPPLDSPSQALSSAIDEGERDAADEGQPAAAGKKKRKGLNRKSSAARQNDEHGKRNDGAGGDH